MDIVIIGSGNVASVIGRKILSAGHRIVQVFSRQPDHAGILAGILQAMPISSLKELERKVDLILIAISDNAYETFVQELPLTDSFIVHTSGSVPMDVLKNTGARYGVLYPLQRFRRELKTIPEFPLLIDANSPGNFRELTEIAIGLSDTVIHANDDMRLKYHLGAVLVSNFTNHLCVLAESYCRQEQIDFSVLQPLREETVYRMGYASPADLQTGPAIRNDTQTLEKHRKLLTSYPELSQLYDVLTRSIQHFHQIK